jgi:hypothetical protein
MLETPDRYRGFSKKIKNVANKNLLIATGEMA